MFPYSVIRDTLCRNVPPRAERDKEDLTDTVCYFHRREDLPDSVWQIGKGRRKERFPLGTSKRSRYHNPARSVPALSPRTNSLLAEALDATRRNLVLLGG